MPRFTIISPWALAQSGRLRDAILQFREALGLNPAYVDARLNLGLSLTQSNGVAGAVKEYRTLLKQHPGSAEVHNNPGLALLQGTTTTKHSWPFEKP